MRTRARKKFAKKGKRNWPYAHQRKCAKWALQPSQTRSLICHDPGTGKTFPFMMMLAVHHVQTATAARGGLGPQGCRQWYQVFLDTRIPEECMHIVKTAKSVTKEMFAKYNVILISRNMIGNIFGQPPVGEAAPPERERLVDQRVGPHPGKPITRCSRPSSTSSARTRRTSCATPRPVDARPRDGRENSRRVVGMTATPVMGKPDDLQGMAIAMDSRRSSRT